MLYGVAANYSRQRLIGVPPDGRGRGQPGQRRAAAGIARRLGLAGAKPQPTAWGAAAMLALVCTGLAYTCCTSASLRAPGARPFP
jgi:hypothetical protein